MTVNSFVVFVLTALLNYLNQRNPSKLDGKFILIQSLGNGSKTIFKQQIMLGINFKNSEWKKQSPFNKNEGQAI